ncbi:stress response protein ysnF [Bacillus sp. AFS076308]|uniref:YsnF/AvaK domain-containing protein n=1 Tax=unclassified Bacillus (in: firmicutes) TaxID=185979 RepID=UPI000BF2B2D0|nr:MULTISPECIES: YsnF/AvaK domain-containing protein [unclassified Bacillus (in: firmicutes)]PFO09380.1 stress response protein ysnF [Bacillus sp. AFS076308]PGV50358.1 stress response protein ysnF [Bacillus sp. AFS037270]
MSMEKRIVGTFNSEQEVLYAIEGLKRQGHRETDMMVVAKYRSDIPSITSQTGVMVEADTQVSTLAGVMMESFFSLMTVGMGGSPANALSSRLIGRGLPVFTAKQCEKEINNGKMILLVDTNETYDSPIYESQFETEKTTAVRLREEQLDITKERVQVGELQLHKEVVEEQRTVYVPLIREEVYIERRPVIDGKYDSSAFAEDEIIRIPITEERIEVTKRPVVVEEVIVGKRKIQETKQVQDIIRKEEARIEHSVPSVTEVVTLPKTEVAHEEVIMENPDILIVEGNPDIENIMKEDKKEESREKRTGSLVVKGEKNKPELPSSNKFEANGTLTDSTVSKEHESESDLPITVANVKEEIDSNENSSKEENKNNKNQIKNKKK